MPSPGDLVPRCLALAITLSAGVAGCAGGHTGVLGGSETDELPPGSAGATSGAGAASGAGGGHATGATAGSGAGTSSGAGAGGSEEVPFVPCPHADFAQRFEEVRASLQSDLAANGVKGGALAIVCESEIKAAGVGVVKAGGAPVTGSTRFQLASLTKMMTATATLALAEEGALDVDEHVGQVMPELAYGGEVTLEHLLTHTSGLPLEFPQFSSDELVPLVLGNKNMSPATTPGSQWAYNNVGYAIIGALMETASGEAFDDLVHDHVLTPIEMTGATMRVGEVLAGGDYAYGHSGASVLGPEDSYYGSASYGPMGGAWGSAEDVARYARALLGNGPLAGRLARQLIPRAPTGEWPGASYGYGLFVDEGVSPTMIFHSGSVEGFLCDMEVIPDAGIAVVVMVNSDAYLPMEVAFQAVEAFVSIQWSAD